MRYLPLLLLLAFFGFTLPSCAQKTTVQKTKTKKVSKTTAATPVKKPAPTETGPIITFERTPCFGTCPSYAMQIYADGRVAYEGRRFVPKEGKQELKLPAAAIADLLRQAQDAHFERFDNRYSRGTTDLPSTIIGVRQPDGKLKTVAVEDGAPEDVQALVVYFGNQFDALAQLKGTGK